MKVMSTPNVNFSNLDSRYSKPTDVSAAISAQAAADAGQYVGKYISFYNSGYTKTNGASLTATDSGMPLSQKANPSGAAPIWAGGALTNQTGSGAQANYSTANLGATCSMVEAEMTFTLQTPETYPKASFGESSPSPADFGEGTLVIWTQDIATTFPSIPYARMHAPMTREFYQNNVYYGTRIVTDGVTTSGSPTVTSATANFTATDLGSPISGPGIPSPAYIGVVNSPTSIGLTSAIGVNTPVNASASGTGVTISLGGPVAIVPVNGSSSIYYFEKPLVADGSTVHHVKAYFPRPDTAIVKLPDGKVLIYKDPRIASFAGNFPCWEHYQTNGASDSLVGFTYMGASTAPQGAQAIGSTEIIDRSEAERQDSRGFAKVTTQWYQRNDAAASSTSGSAVITDAAILAADLWKPVSGTNITGTAYVGTVTPGVGFRLSSTQFTQTDLTATANGTFTANIGTVSLAVTTSYTDVGGLWVTAPYIPKSGRLLFTASVFCSMPTTGTRVLLGLRKASSGSLLYGEAALDTNTYVGQIVKPILLSNLTPSFSPVTFVLQADAVAAGDATIKIASGGFAASLSVEPA